MSNTKSSCLLACEILWDCVEGQIPLLGGATLNVAYHLNQLGCEIFPLSSVGSDKLGELSFKIIKDEWHCDTTGISVLNNIDTGVVDVKIDDLGDASYVIHTPAAWDYISIEKSSKNMSCQAFVYGSVALRSSFNQQTFNDFINIYQGLKCFDVNLREGQNNIEVVFEFLKKADFIKLNEDELIKVAHYLSFKFSDTNVLVLQLIQLIGEKTICITRGEKDPILYWQKRIYTGNSVPVKVKNTIGAGDAFFSSMIYSLINPNFDPIKALNRASLLASWVVTKEGAQPKYDNEIRSKLLLTAPVTNS